MNSPVDMHRGPVIFAVLAHHMPRLIERLLQRLHEARDALILVHEDAKSDELPALPPGGRATFLPERLDASWGTLGLVDATLACMHWACTEVSNFSWLVLLSGQDYPARHCASIEAELLTSPADAFIHWEHVPPVASHRSSDWQRGSSKRYYWHRFPNTYRPIPVPRARCFIDGVGVFAGAHWWNLSHRAVRRILDQTSLLEYLHRRFSPSVYIPEEAFFQTALLHQPLGLKIVNDHRRFFRFPQTGGASHPETLSIRDLGEIISHNAFFIRKVDNEVSEPLLDQLDVMAQRSGRVPHY